MDRLLHWDGPGLAALASSYQNVASSKSSFVSINGKELAEIVKRHEVKTAPCVTYLHDGQVLESIKGFDLTKIREALNRHAGVNLDTVPVTTTCTMSTPILERDNGALLARLTELVKTARVVLFMKGTPYSPPCRFNRRIVSLLRENNIDFDSFNVLANEDVREGLKEYADWPTYPQLWVDGKLLGGLDVVREEIKADPEFLTRCSVMKPAINTLDINTHHCLAFVCSQKILAWTGLEFWKRRINSADSCRYISESERECTSDRYIGQSKNAIDADQ